MIMWGGSNCIFGMFDTIGPNRDIAIYLWCNNVKEKCNTCLPSIEMKTSGGTITPWQNEGERSLLNFLQRKNIVPHNWKTGFTTSQKWMVSHSSGRDCKECKSHTWKGCPNHGKQGIMFCLGGMLNLIPLWEWIQHHSVSSMHASILTTSFLLKLKLITCVIARSNSHRLLPIWREKLRGHYHVTMTSDNDFCVWCWHYPERHSRVSVNAQTIACNAPRIRALITSRNDRHVWTDQNSFTGMSTEMIKKCCFLCVFV